MQGKWALEEHLSTAENNKLWEDSGEASQSAVKHAVAKRSGRSDLGEGRK